MLIWYYFNIMIVKPRQIYLTKPQEEKLIYYSEMTGLSYAEIVRRALDDYFERKMQNVSCYSDKSTEKSES